MVDAKGIVWEKLFMKDTEITVTLDVTMAKEYVEAGINFEKMHRDFKPKFEVDARKNKGFIYLQSIHKWNTTYSKAMSYEGSQLEPGTYEFELIDWKDPCGRYKSTVTLRGRKFFTNFFMVMISRRLWRKYHKELTVKASEIKKSHLRDEEYMGFFESLGALQAKLEQPRKDMVEVVEKLDILLSPEKIEEKQLSPELVVKAAELRNKVQAKIDTDRREEEKANAIGKAVVKTAISATVPHIGAVFMAERVEKAVANPTAAAGAGLIGGTVLGELADLVDGVYIAQGVEAEVEISETGEVSTNEESPTTKNTGVHWVDGYTRADGTHVEGHFRSNPDGITSNNLNKKVLSSE